jgi:hypothetical protein
MADMIDAKEAKSLLNCDDAALNNHINSGAIRAQRVQGKLMLNKEDVAKVVKESGDEGTIVLTGDSDELSIDLGKVVDDASETIVQPRKDSSNATESITFGDELEVVSFDDGNTKDLNFDKTKATQPGNLSFTDSNTAVMTAVDETHVGGTTGPIDFQTSQIENSGPQNVGGSSRRSVRSNRARAEQVKVHWIWPSLMALTLVLGLALILPYYFITMMPHAFDEKDAKGNVRRGLDDNGWTNMASGVAGFSVEPDSAKFKQTHPDGEWMDMKNPDKDPQAEWRFKQYQGKFTKPGERLDTFVITEVQQEGKKAKSKLGDVVYDVIEPAPPANNTSVEIKEPKVNLGFPNK